MLFAGCKFSFHSSLTSSEKHQLSQLIHDHGGASCTLASTATHVLSKTWDSKLDRVKATVVLPSFVEMSVFQCTLAAASEHEVSKTTCSTSDFAYSSSSASSSASFLGNSSFSFASPSTSKLSINDDTAIHLTKSDSEDGVFACFFDEDFHEQQNLEEQNASKSTPMSKSKRYSSSFSHSSFTPSSSTVLSSTSSFSSPRSSVLDQIKLQQQQAANERKQRMELAAEERKKRIDDLVSTKYVSSDENQALLTPPSSSLSTNTINESTTPHWISPLDIPSRPAFNDNNLDMNAFWQSSSSLNTSTSALAPFPSIAVPSSHPLPPPINASFDSPFTFTSFLRDSDCTLSTTTTTTTSNTTTTTTLVDQSLDPLTASTSISPSSSLSPSSSFLSTSSFSSRSTTMSSVLAASSVRGKELSNDRKKRIEELLKTTTTSTSSSLTPSNSFSRSFSPSPSPSPSPSASASASSSFPNATNNQSRSTCVESSESNISNNDLFHSACSTSFDYSFSSSSNAVLDTLKQYNREKHQAEFLRAKERKEENAAAALQKRLARKEEVRVNRLKNLEQNRLQAEERKRLKEELKNNQQADKKLTHEEWLQRQADWEIEKQRRAVLWEEKKIEMKMDKVRKKEQFLEQKERILEENAREYSRKVFVGKLSCADMLPHMSSLHIDEQERLIAKRRELWIAIMKLYGNVVAVKEHYDKEYMFVLYDNDESAAAAIQSLDVHSERVRVCNDMRENITRQNFQAFVAPVPSFYARLPKRTNEGTINAPRVPLERERSEKLRKKMENAAARGVVFVPKSELKEREKEREKEKEVERQKEMEKERMDTDGFELVKKKKKTESRKPTTTTTKDINTNKRGAPSRGRARGRAAPSSRPSQSPSLPQNLDTLAPSSSFSPSSRGGMRGSRRGRGESDSIVRLPRREVSSARKVEQWLNVGVDL